MGLQRVALAVALLGLLGAGCINLELPDGECSGVVGQLTDCPGCAQLNGLSGEAMLFVNGKLTLDCAGYEVNARDPQGRYLGSALFLYQPGAQGQPGTLVKLGNVVLGEDPGSQQGYEKMQFRDVAWSREHGLWAVTIDPYNDEWRLTHVEVPDFKGVDGRFPHRSYALRTSDAAYWENDLSGMAFVGGRLLVGGHASESLSDPGGAVWEMAVPTGWSEDPVYPGDHTFYSDRLLSTLWGRLPANLGTADLVEGPGGSLEVLVRSERAEVKPLEANYLFRSPAGGPSFTDSGLALPAARRTEDFQGLARLDGMLYAIDGKARVFRLNEENGSAVLVDDLSSRFADPLRGLRIRGATTVEVH